MVLLRLSRSFYSSFHSFFGGSVVWFRCFGGFVASFRYFGGFVPVFLRFRWFWWFRSGGFDPVVSGFSTCHLTRLGGHWCLSVQRFSAMPHCYSIRCFLTKINRNVFNPFPFEWVLRALKDFTLSNARRFYSSMGNLLDRKGLTVQRITAPPSSTTSPSWFAFILIRKGKCKGGYFLLCWISRRVISIRHMCRPMPNFTVRSFFSRQEAFWKTIWALQFNDRAWRR